MGRKLGGPPGLGPDPDPDPDPGPGPDRDPDWGLGEDVLAGLEGLEGEFQARLREQAELEAMPAIRAEVGATAMWEQLARRVGVTVTVTVWADAGVFRGRLAGAHRDFGVVELDDAGGVCLVRLGAGVSIGFDPASLPPRRPVPQGLAREITFALSLRDLARRREPVRLYLMGGGQVTGTIEAAGKDYLQLAEHEQGEPRRAAAIRGHRFIPFAAVSFVLLPAAGR